MATDVERARRLFTVDEYDRIVAAGVFGPDDRLELINGEIVEMSPIGERHAACVANLNRIFVTGLVQRAVVWIQNPVRVPVYSKPQPDLALLRPRSYFRAGAAVEDVLCLIEVADTSLGYDRGVKLLLYAKAGIPEYWLVDVDAEIVEIFRDPGARGYREALRIAREGAVAPLAFPDLTIPVADFFA